jgi:eukaryotic-like serine/threonine-protein kinase
VNDPRRARIEAIFEAALDAPRDQRDALIATLSEGDGGLAREVSALLAASEHASGLLERPLAGAEFALPDEPRPERIGPYRIEGELGRGGMGVVYRAERDDGQFHLQVAIKVLRGGFLAESLRRRFEMERQILATLDHPGIARLLDGGLTPDRRPYLVMDYVDGLPIDRYAARHALSIDARIRLGAEVAHAVHHAHRRLVVHRDLKPSNILVTPEGPRLLDFGIAKLLDPSVLGPRPAETGSGLRPMTPGYASPEQVAGEPITTGTDVYSLGVVVYQLLTGRLPFPVDPASLGRWEVQVLDQSPPRPSAVAPDPVTRRRLRGDLDRILLKALEREPERRYGSAEELAADLERHLDGRPVLARGDAAWYRLRRFVGRHRIQAAAVGLVAVSLVVGAGVALWQAAVARRAQARAEAAQLVAQSAAAQSREVSDFLIDLFQADQTARLDRSASSGDLVRWATGRIDALGSQPVLQARLLDALGRVQLNLGRFADGGALLERALVLRRAQSPEGNDAVAETLVNLGRWRNQMGDYAGAEGYLREAVAIRDRVPGSAPDQARALIDLARVVTSQGRLNEADSLHLRSLALRRQALGPDDPELARSLIARGALFRRRRMFDSSEATMREALALTRRVLPPDDPRIAEAMLNLGYTLELRPDAGDEVERLTRAAVAIRRHALGDRHPDVAIALKSVAAALVRKGDGAGAVAILEEARAISESAFGPDHPQTISTLEQIAGTYETFGDLERARRLLERGLTLRRRAYSPRHVSIGGALYNLARVYLAQGELELAERASRESVAIREEALGWETPLVGVSSQLVGRVRAARGDTADAELLFLRALRILRSQGGDDHPEVGHTARLLIDLYEAQGRRREADELRPLLAGG